MRRVAAKVRPTNVPGPPISSSEPISEGLRGDAKAIKLVGDQKPTNDTKVSRRSGKKGLIRQEDIGAIIALARTHSKGGKVLTREEEAVLFKVCDTVDRRLGTLEKKLVKANGSSDAIKEEIERLKGIRSMIASVVVPSNQGLSYLWASRMYWGKGVHHLALEDLAQQNSLALQEDAMGHFDYRTGNKFSTYASWWLRSSLNRQIADQERVVRVPVHVHEAKSKIDTFVKGFVKINEREPSTEEIAEGFVKSFIKKGKGEPTAEQIEKAKEKSLEWVEKTMRLLQGPVKSKGEDGDLDVLDTIPQTTIPDAFAVVAALSDKALVRKLMGCLNPNEVLVISVRFELEGAERKTLQQLGDEKELSRERIRQIEHEALKKMGREYRRLSLTLKSQSEQ